MSAARAEIEELYREYVDALDEGELALWPELFLADGVYRIASRENVERGLPLAAMLCEGRGALRDRVWAIEHASFYVPRAQRHVLSSLRIADEGADAWRVAANYAVFQSLPEQLSTVFSVGRYRDRLARGADGRIRFAEKLCIYDSALIPNSLVLPL